MNKALSKPLPDSPFIAGSKLQYAWDSVSLGVMLSCPRKYQLQIIEGWQPANPNHAIALDFGILFHKMLEEYHNFIFAGQSHDEATASCISSIIHHPRYANLPTAADIEKQTVEFDAIAASSSDDDDGISLRNSKIRTRYHLLRSFVWYVEHYRNDPFKTLVVKNSPAVEVSFRVEFPFTMMLPDYSGEHPVLLCGHIDRAIEFNDEYYVTDFKTTKSITQQFFSSFSLSHQFSGYTYAGGIVFDKPVAGAYVDAIALQVGGVQFSRAPVDKTQGQINEYFETVQEIISRATDYAAQNYYPMNTQSCYFCEFKDICRQPPEFRKTYLNQHFMQKPAWNPLENR